MSGSDAVHLWTLALLSGVTESQTFCLECCTLSIPDIRQVGGVGSAVLRPAEPRPSSATPLFSAYCPPSHYSLLLSFGAENKRTHSLGVKVDGFFPYFATF